MTSHVRIIRTKAEYQESLKRLGTLMDVDFKPGSEQENEFELLRLVIGAYEAEHAKRPPVDPIEAINFRLEQQGLINDGQFEAMAAQATAHVHAAVREADADPFPPLEDRFNDILAEQYPYEPGK